MASTETSAELFDITILGAGPAGLFAAYYSGFRTFRVKIIDALPALGGQVGTVYGEREILDVPGYPRIMGRELVEQLQAQADQHHPTICLGERAHTLRRETDGSIRIITDRGEHHTRVVLLTGLGVPAAAAGAGPGLDGHGAQPGLKALRLEEMPAGFTFDGDAIRVTTRMETGVPGIYAAGDAATYPGKLRLIAVSFSEACTAVNNAATYINPKASVFPGHSSTKVEQATGGAMTGGEAEVKL